MTEEDSETLIGSQEMDFQELSQALINCLNTPGLLNESQFRVVGNSTSSNGIEMSSSLRMFTPINDAHDINDNQQIKKRTNEKMSSKRKPKKNRGKSAKRGKFARSTTIENSNPDDLKIEANQSRVDREPSTPESVSLLRECYEVKAFEIGEDFPELLETCMETQLEIIHQNPIDKERNERRNFIIHSDVTFNERNRDETIGDEVFFDLTPTKKIDKYCQTDCSLFTESFPHRRNEQMNQGVKFIRSIICLKNILLTKSEISKGTLNKVLDPKFKLNVLSGYRDDDVIQGDSMQYMLRSANVDGIFETAVSSLLNGLEKTLERDSENLAVFWRDSIYELAVKTLNEAIRCEAKLKKLSDVFLKNLITSILNEDKTSKNLNQEIKSSFLVIFCESTDHCYVAINHIITKLKGLNEIKRRGNSPLSDISVVHDWSRLAKNSYFLMRALKKLLESLSAKQGKDEPKTVNNQKAVMRNYNVLEMWKKHWRQADALIEKESSDSDCLSRDQWNTLKWCEDLDEILIHSIDHFPILANIIEKCTRLAKNVSRKSDSGLKI